MLKSENGYSLSIIIISVIILLTIIAYFTLKQQTQVFTEQPEITVQNNRREMEPSTLARQTFPVAGISISYPENAIVHEQAQLSDFSIKGNTNHYTNGRLSDGWDINLSFRHRERESIASIEKIEKARDLMKESGCGVTEISSVKLDGQTAWRYYTTGCGNTDTSWYYFSNDTYDFTLFASYSGTEQDTYKNLTEAIISSIQFVY